MRGHFYDVVDLSWTRDSTTLISSSFDKTFVIWNIKADGSGEKVRSFEHHKGKCQGVAINPLGTLIASISED